MLGIMAADLLFNRWAVSIGTYQGASVIIRRVFDWKRSRISMLDVDVVSPELYAVGPDGFEYRLINEDFVAGR
jgi:hypothetical protein